MPGDAAALRLFVVIPVHNRRGYTRQCLERLQDQTWRDFSIIVVDDGSRDGTAEMLRRDYPSAMLLLGDGTLWWSGATNLGVAAALDRGATAILCLNDDTVPAPDFVERLLETFVELPDTLVGACAIDVTTGRRCFAGERVNWFTGGSRSLLAECSERIVTVSHAPGRGLLVPASVFRRIGLFDAARFPQTAADYDFTHRARRAGYRLVCDRAAVLGMYAPEPNGDFWPAYRSHLFDPRGSGNLRTFFRYAVRNCPRPLLPVCLAAGLVRRIGGFPLARFRECWR